MIDQRQPVPRLLELLHEPDKPHVVVLPETPIGRQLDQMLQTGEEGIASSVERCRLSHPPEGHA